MTYERARAEFLVAMQNEGMPETVANFARDLLHAAIQQADERAGRTGERCTVYHAKQDRYGRDVVWYVRSDQEGPPPGLAARDYDTVYVATAPTRKDGNRSVRRRHGHGAGPDSPQGRQASGGRRDGG